MLSLVQWPATARSLAPASQRAPLSRNEMLAGGEYPRWSAVSDAGARLLCLPGSSLRALQRAVEKAISDPTYKRLRRGARPLFAESCREDLPETYTKPCAVAHEMLAFNLASLGCRQAHAEISGGSTGALQSATWHRAI